MTIDMDKPFAEFAEDHLKTPEGRKTTSSAASERDRLLNAVQMAYRKHHMDDERIGWEELDKLLFDTLCEVMGDGGFVKWMDEVAP